MEFKIWHPNDLNSAHWFVEGTGHKVGWIPHQIPTPGSAEFLNLPERMKGILRLDSPDLIATIAQDGGPDRPVASIELTTTTPHGQHPKQRVPRLVAAAEAGVPAIFIVPRHKWDTAGKYLYHLGLDVYFVAHRIDEFNGVPVLVYHYPDSDGVLVHDPNFPNQPLLADRRTRKAFRSIDAIIANALAGKGIGSLAQDTWLNRERLIHARAAGRTKISVERYPSLSLHKTADLAAFLATNTDLSTARITKTLARLPSRITRRDETLVFSPKGRMFKHAGDPYVGMMAFFDYAFCRQGSSVEERRRNLVYMPRGDTNRRLTAEFGPAGYHSFWEKKCPFRSPAAPNIDGQFTVSHTLQYGCLYRKSKPLRIYGYFSDMIVFDDAVLVF